jgi:hypothetical protein
MKKISTFILTIILLFNYKLANAQDWLIKPISQKAHVKIEGNTIELNNGLVKRRFVVGQNLACFDYVNLSNNQQLPFQKFHFALSLLPWDLFEQTNKCI